MPNLDKRVNPYREDLAANYLRGQVEAKDYREPTRHQIMLPVVPLHKRPSVASGMETQLLFGTYFDVYDSANGWAWGQEVGEQDAIKGYVGYVPKMALSLPVFTPTHRINAMRAPLFSKSDLKSAIRNILPLNAKIEVDRFDGDYAKIGSQGYIHKKHIVDIDEVCGDFVSMAEQFLGLPYIWGGASPDGVDCSGLVQISLRVVGKDAPRDADMQERALGKEIQNKNLKRGDLVFWQGHVGIMQDGENLLHANAHHMKTATEPLSQAKSRIAKTGSEVTKVKRL